MDIKPRQHGLDTLRAIAILAVMAFHLQGTMPDAFGVVARFGWMGVDLFFVLSGYLIGSQVFRPYVKGQRMSTWSFYRRRLYRVLPAYFAVLLLYFAVPLWREAPGISPAWQFLTFTQNLLIDYGTNQAFSHAWSLCVEEHFYMILPLVVLWTMRRPALWKAVALVTALLVLGIAVRSSVLFHELRPLARREESYGLLYIEHTYYPTYSRLDGLLAGVTLSLIQLFRPAWWQATAGRGYTLLLVGTVLVGTSVWLFHDRLGVFGVSAVGNIVGFPILSLGLAMIVASAVSSNGLLRLRLPGAALISTLAYSLYLTHKEIVHLLDHFFPQIEDAGGLRWMGLVLVSCFTAAAALFYAVERPFLLVRDLHARGEEKDGERAVGVESAL